MAKKKPVFVLVYSHRHGTDIGVYTSEPKAWKAAAYIAAEWVDQDELLDDDAARRRFTKLFKAKKYKEAALTYTKALVFQCCFSGTRRHGSLTSAVR